MCKERETRDFAALSLRGNIFISLPPPSKAQRMMKNRSQKKLYEPEVMDYSKEIVSSRYNRTEELIETVVAHIRPAQVQARQCLGTQKGK